MPGQQLMQINHYIILNNGILKSITYIHTFSGVHAEGWWGGAAPGGAAQDPGPGGAGLAKDQGGQEEGQDQATGQGSHQNKPKSLDKHNL